MVCDECFGTGNSPYACSSCEGSGSIQDPIYNYECSSCGGSGYREEPLLIDPDRKATLLAEAEVRLQTAREARRPKQKRAENISSDQSILQFMIFLLVFCGILLPRYAGVITISWWIASLLAWVAAALIAMIIPILMRSHDE
jgi:hypothetical protein